MQATGNLPESPGSRLLQHAATSMIYFDVTKAGPHRHRSGLTRVSGRLRECLQPLITEVAWNDGMLAVADAKPVPARAGDWFFTAELFSEAERPGFSAFLEARSCRLAAVFHDAIPLKHPHITWPQSVARHPGYMKLLARFDRVWAVSAASRDELLGFWRWQEIERPPPVDVLPLGADFHGAPRTTARRPAPTHRLLCTGIIEPRKNQSFLLEVCAELWGENLAFELHLVGRVNPHFGRPIVSQIAELRRRFPPRLHFHETATDAQLAELYLEAHATVFPTMAEGCGLPLLESLWMGAPCVCSDLPVLRENAGGGGCLAVACNDRIAWKEALRRILTDDALHTKLTNEATSRPLPTWAHAAAILTQALVSRNA